MDQLDLLDQYPHSPGYRRSGTSQAAAEAAKPRARTLRERVLDVLRGADLTADEVAAKLGVTVLACRPRLSEAFKLGLIEDTGRTRANESGVRATVWRAV